MFKNPIHFFWQLFAILAFAAFVHGTDFSQLKTQLQDDSPEKRKEALLELAKLNEPKGNQLIINALDDPSDYVRKHAAFFLGKIGEKNAVTKLSKVVYFDASPEVSIFAAEALYALGLKSGLKVLISYIKNTNISLALLAIEKLETLKEKTALPVLKEVSEAKVSLTEIKNRAGKAYRVIKGDIKMDAIKKARNIVEAIYAKSEAAESEETINELKKAIALDPELPDIYWILGNLHFNDSTKWRQALEEFKKARDLGYTERGNLFFAMGTTYLNLGQFKEAIAVLTQAAAEKKEADIYYQLGVVYSRINNIPKAVEVTEEAIKIDPTYVAAYYNLSQLYKSLGNKAKSSQYFEQYQLLSAKK